MSGIQQMLMGGSAGRVVYAGAHFDSSYADAVSGSWPLEASNWGVAASASGAKFGGGLLYQDSGYGCAVLGRGFAAAGPWCCEFFLGNNDGGMFESETTGLFGVSAPNSFSVGWRLCTNGTLSSQFNLHDAALYNDAGALIGSSLGAQDYFYNYATLIRHFSLGWDGATYRLLLDGQLVWSLASNVPVKTPTEVRAGLVGGSYQAGNIYVDDLVITNQPRTANFTVPTAPFVV